MKDHKDNISITTCPSFIIFVCKADLAPFFRNIRANLSALHTICIELLNLFFSRKRFSTKVSNHSHRDKQVRDYLSRYRVHTLTFTYLATKIILATLKKLYSFLIMRNGCQTLLESSLSSQHFGLRRSKCDRPKVNF